MHLDVAVIFLRAEGTVADLRQVRPVLCHQVQHLERKKMAEKYLLERQQTQQQWHVLLMSLIIIILSTLTSKVYLFVSCIFMTQDSAVSLSLRDARNFPLMYPE